MRSKGSARGRVARLVAGAGTVEIKATIPQKQIRSGLARFGLSERNTEQRFIYFFDTPDLSLFRAGVIARARRIVGQQHDTTIKIRPVQPENVPAKWHEERGFKIEADASEKGVVRSASLTKPVAKGLIKRVGAGNEPMKSLMHERQELFLLEVAPARYDFAELVVLGPIEAWRWKFADPGLPWPITAELWKREDGATILEVSTKTPAAQAAAAGAGFFAFLRELGAKRDILQEAKTRWALDYYASKLRGGMKRKSTSRAPKKGRVRRNRSKK
jgi:hypothetical protein